MSKFLLIVLFYQRDYTDCTELLLSHTEGTELTNGKVKTENGKLVWMILLLIIFEDNVFATVLLESNWEYRKTLIVYRLTRIECKEGIDGKGRGVMN